MEVKHKAWIVIIANDVAEKTITQAETSTFIHPTNNIKSKKVALSKHPYCLLSKDAIKSKKVALSSTLEDFKVSLAEDITLQPVSDINLKLVFDELYERVKLEKKKEAKRLEHLPDNFYNLLVTSKDLTTTSKWEMKRRRRTQILELVALLFVDREEN
ncbi:hypothetical protein Vadar_007579 [Vaccinium darrowii]|uniref:Uncharacterized protein n=1 Tax=Vaccinium darrowii TaxID=229202 RepID=A0ACB7YUK4_9ERIC|nr:hypothetical protein Vadar_007579 [Vaccinium darrowii]